MYTYLPTFYLMPVFNNVFVCLLTGKKNYSCHHCNTEFEHPNPLKIHMFLSCRPYEAGSFWKRCISRLRAATVPPAMQFPQMISSPVPSFPASPPPDPAQLEALAAAWGRSRDGHVCLYCGKLYSRKYGLKIHIRTHTGYKPLRCRHCLRAFGDPSNLNKHVRLHAAAAGPAGAGDAGGAHACPLCRKPLARRRDLHRHMRTHHPHHTYSDVSA